ncbi:MAG: redoxin domain-containing protein [Anaerolineae bacterium]|nr:redoxin domain-containing protein [Anaerolineae bacterium]
MAEPLTFEDLRGKIVLLDFWTYGCVNCLHVIPDFKRLEAEYPDSLVVVGIHSAKFDSESLTANIRQIAQRYGVEHPIVNDSDLVLMRDIWGAPAWPTTVLIDPLGRVVDWYSGEGVYEVFKPVLEVMVQEYGAAGLLDPTPIPLTPVTQELMDTPLRFPGKVLADPVSGRLFIADTGHNRLVIASLQDYSVLEVIGSGEAALVDGDFASAAFNSPHGLSLAGDLLYVADTNNHVIRAVDLVNRQVTTVAGTGEMATQRLGSGPALEMALRSPWDVLADGDSLYIAMAGSHQLYRLDLTRAALEPFVGNGREDLIDGPRLEAELAQPSGLALHAGYLYFADSESSAIRRVDLAAGRVETIIGPVNAPRARLFIFGDVDGGLDEARLQHPLGVTVAPDGAVYIADTYNNKIKRLDAEARTSTTFAGAAEDGYTDGNLSEARFDEPGGLHYAGGKLYIADTNNHVIRVLDLATESVTTMVFPNVTALLPEGAATSSPAPVTPSSGGAVLSFGEDRTLRLPPQTVAPGEGSILIDAQMPLAISSMRRRPLRCCGPAMVW